MFILSNTWGPADPDGARFTEMDYMMKEIPALADLGIDVFQIDDGWQKGGRSSDAKDFEPRYKEGWKTIKAQADKYNLRLGLWVTGKILHG
jgi:alpha-galactosidase